MIGFVQVAYGILAEAPQNRAKRIFLQKKRTKYLP